MPRARKTLSGDKAQNVKSVPGQRYGEGVAQQGMQKSMPAPERQAPTPPKPVPLPEPTDQGVRPSPQPVQVTRQTDVGGRPRPEPMPRITRGTDPNGFPYTPEDMQRFIGQLPKNLLTQPAVPGKPLTSGVPIGPGPGPRLSSPGQVMSKYRRTLLQLAAATDNPTIRRMLERN